MLGDPDKEALDDSVPLCEAEAETLGVDVPDGVRVRVALGVIECVPELSCVRDTLWLGVDERETLADTLWLGVSERVGVRVALGGRVEDAEGGAVGQPCTCEGDGLVAPTPAPPPNPRRTGTFAHRPAQDDVVCPGVPQ